MRNRRLILPAVMLSLGLAMALDWVPTGELAGAVQVNDLALGPGGRLYAAANTGTGGRVFYSEDFQTWQLSGALPGTVAAARSLALTGAGELLLGVNGDYGGHSDAPLVHKSADGLSWSFVSRVTGTRVGTTVRALLVDGAGNIHAGHDVPLGMSGAGPCRSTDQGASWAQPAVPANPDGMGPFTQYDIIQAPDHSIYVGAWNAGGRMLKSTDRGVTWQHTGGMYDAGHVQAAVAAPDGRLFAGTAPKNVPAEPIGRVFRSTDGGANWVQVGYGSFSTTKWVNALVLVSDGRLFAGAAPRTVGNDAEVFVSADGGASWSSAGTLPGATEIYRLLEVEVSGQRRLYAATGPQGRVFRAGLDPVGASEPEPWGPRPAGPVTLSITPNPVPAGIATLRVQGTRLPASVFTVSVYDASGRPVLRESASRSSQSALALDFSDLSSGVYLVRVETGGSAATGKLVIRRCGGMEADRQ